MLWVIIKSLAWLLGWKCWWMVFNKLTSGKQRKADTVKNNVSKNMLIKNSIKALINSNRVYIANRYAPDSHSLKWKQILFNLGFELKQ